MQVSVKFMTNFESKYKCASHDSIFISSHLSIVSLIFAHTDKAVKRLYSECVECENIFLSLENCKDRESLYVAVKGAVEYVLPKIAIFNADINWETSNLASIHFHQTDKFLDSSSRVLISLFRSKFRSRLSHSLSLCKLYPTSTTSAGYNYTCNIQSGHPNGGKVDAILTLVLIKSRPPEGAVGSGPKPPIAHLPPTVALLSNEFQQSVSTASGSAVFTATILHSFATVRSYHWIPSIVQFEYNRPKLKRSDVVIDSLCLPETSFIHHACMVDLISTAANG